MIGQTVRAMAVYKALISQPCRRFLLLISFSDYAVQLVLEGFSLAVFSTGVQTQGPLHAEQTLCQAPSRPCDNSFFRNASFHRAQGSHFLARLLVYYKGDDSGTAGQMPDVSTSLEPQNSPWALSLRTRAVDFLTTGPCSPSPSTAGAAEGP